VFCFDTARSKTPTCRVRMKLRSKIRKGAQPAIEKGKAVTVWNKQGDTWKAVADISNTDAPPPAHKKSRSGDRPQSNLDFLFPCVQAVGIISGRKSGIGLACPLFLSISTSLNAI
jgi:hypothetical protein